MSIRAAVTMLAATVAILAGGCATDPTSGYSPASLYAPNVRSVAVPIVANDTLVRDVEFQLTDALIKEISARTPYVVTSRDRADTVLLGTIRRIDLQQLSKSPVTGLAEEMIVEVMIDFEWEDLNSGAILLERRSFAGHKLFVPSSPSSERIELGRFAVVQQLARDVVSEMQAEW